MGNIKSKIVPLQEDLVYVNLMVYADSGTGKTVFGGSDDRVLFIAPEDSGTISAKRHGSKADKWPVQSWNDLLEAYEYLYDQIEENGSLPYDWIVIDSLTEMQYMAMSYVLKKGVEDRPTKDPEVPEIQDWQRYYIIFEKMVRAFNDLDVNVLYTALARKVEDAEGEDFYVPDIQGKDYLLAMKIASLMTSFGQMVIELQPQIDAEGNETGKKVRRRRIYWEDTETSRGKDRTRALAPTTDGLTLKAVRRKIEGYEVPEPRKAPVKKAPAKKVAARKAPANTHDPETGSELPNPANTPDNAADLADSVPSQ